MRDTGHRVVVVFRKLPDEPNSCLVVESDALPDRYHQNLMDSVESITAQETMEFHDYAHRQYFSDGSNMLATLHQKGYLIKVPTNRVIMRPRIDLEINLSELNAGIDQVESGVESEEIVQSNSFEKDDVISDAALAANLRAQAEMFEKQAADLREQANTLDPVKPAKKTRLSTKSKTTA